MENKKLTLLTIMWNKEKIHWSRMLKLFIKMDTFGAKIISYPIIVLLVSFGHYAFMFMHTSFELVLFFMNKPHFIKNLNTINNKITEYNQQITTA